MFLRAIGATVAPQRKDPPPLLTVRSTVVFSAAAVAAGASGVGTYLGTREPFTAAVTGGGVFFGAAAWLHKHVGV